MKKEQSNHDRLEKSLARQQDNLMLEQEDIDRLPKSIASPTMSKLLQVAEISTILKVMAGFVIAAIIIVALYVGKEILIPLALSILFGFLLNPLVLRLKKIGIAKVPAIAIVVLMTLGVLGGAGTYFVSQLGGLSQELPQYQDTITQKLNSLKSFARGPSVWDGAIKTIDNVEHSINTVNQKKKHDKDVQQVEVVSQNQSVATSVFEWGSKVLSPLATAGIVFVFVVLILLDRKDLHDRLLRLFGSNLNVGTDALDEAADRIGKYLRMQLIVNLTYGVPMAIGLLVIGVPAAVMWGMVAVVMRFVPYVGPIISAIFPITLAFAVDPGWDMALWTIGLVLVLELITNNIIEPWLYGESTGLSTLAIMVAATFWTTIWGPIGLILSTPITACILVLSNYVPALSFVKIVLGNEPALKPPERFYQRLVADDKDAALDIAVEYIKEHLPKNYSPDLLVRRVNEFYEDVAIPAVRLFSNAQHNAAKAEHRLRMHMGMRMFNRDFQHKYPADNHLDNAKVYCLGARWEVDTNISAMLAHGLQLRNIAAESGSEAILQTQSEVLNELPDNVEIICVSVFHPEPLALIRLIQYQIREKLPHVKLIFATWNVDSRAIQDEIQQRFNIDAVVDEVNEVLLTIDALLFENGHTIAAKINHEDEVERAESIQHLGLMNEKNLPIYEQYIEETKHAFDVDYAQVVWLDSDWVYTPAGPFVALNTPIEASKILRKHSIFTYLIDQQEDLIIEDLKRDPRFRDNQNLRNNHLRFFAAVPIRDKKGLILGGLCILDRQSRELSEDDLELLHEIAEGLMRTLSSEKRRDAMLDILQDLD